MARNGSGTYSLPSGNPVTTGTTISSTVQNNTMSDIATALTQSLAKDGQTTPTANLPMGGYKHTGAAAGSARTDYATISNIQDGTGIYVSTVGGTADVITLTPSPAITSYSAGQTFSFTASGANTGATTVNISGLGAKDITKEGSTALIAGDIKSGAVVWITYDGTRFQIVTPQATAKNGVITSSGLTISSNRVAGRTTAGTGAIEEQTLSQILDYVGSAAQGDILYRGAATWARLAAGTSGQVLQTTGGSGNPAWADVPKFKVVATTRDVSLASGNASITGAGFTPKAIIVFGIVGTLGSATGQAGLGIGRSAAEVFGMSNAGNISASSWVMNNDRLFDLIANGTDQTAVDIVSLDSDGCTLSYTKSGSPTGTARIQIMFIG